MPSLSFSLSVEIALRGELDLLTASEIRTNLLAVASATQEVEIVVDLAQVAFADTTGLQPLVEAQQLLSESGRSLLLRDVPLPVARLIHAAGLADSLNMCELTREPAGAGASTIPNQRARPDFWSLPEA